MSTTGLPAFDETVQLTNAWLRDLMDLLHTEDRQFAYRSLRSVLHALRDQLEPELAAHLAAQLPMLVRGFYFEGWNPARTPGRDRHFEAFAEHVQAEMRGTPEDTGRVAQAVFDLLRSRISGGEYRKVVTSLPRGLRERLSLQC